MKVLVRVADAGSFANAGRQLHMSPPAVTRAVAFLEEETGARLLVRTTRSVKPTASGARYVEDCRRILADVEEAEASASGSHATPSGTLTITAPVQFGQLHVMPIVTEFLTLYPSITGRVLLLDRIVNIAEEGIDVAIRIGAFTASEHSAHRIGTVRRVVCGSPDYFARHGTPKRPTDLARHTIIANTGSSAPLDWRFGPKHTPTVLKPRLYCNTVDAAVSAAIAGWGLARCLSYQVARPVADGQLVTVLDDHEEEPLPIHLLHAAGRYVSAKTRAFADFAVDRLKLRAASSALERTPARRNTSLPNESHAAARSRSVRTLRAKPLSDGRS